MVGRPLQRPRAAIEAGGDKMGGELQKSLRDILNGVTSPAAEALYDRRDGGAVQCHACAHECVIADGGSGICQVRINKGGMLHAPRGYVETLAVDPVEKKPFYHVLPGSRALSFGMLGCNFKCSFCQNWYTAQVLRDPGATGHVQRVTADQMVMTALREGCSCLVSTYNEPLITTDWAAEVFERARPQGLVCGYVSNGFATPRVLRFLRNYAQLFKVDLKTFDEGNYRALGGRLKPVLDSIVLARELGFWVEIVTLVVPGFNDSTDELQKMARFLVSVSPDLPWHVTAFHPQYKMQDRVATPPETLARAHQIGKEAGLHFVYAGNLPGMIDIAENTYCPNCKELLVERLGFTVRKNRLDQGRCPKCHEAVAGVWG